MVTTLRAFVIGLLLGAIMMSGSTLARIVGNPIVVYIESPEEIQRGWEAEIGKESEKDLTCPAGMPISAS